MDSMVHKIALSFLPGITADLVRHVAQSGLSLQDFFSLNMPELAASLNMKESSVLQNVVRQEALFKARAELEFITRHSIRYISLLDDDYPLLLREIPDAPVGLFCLGKARLDSVPAVGVVGTRRCTAYGTSFCNSFVSDLAPYFKDALIVSGLAFGIDAAAHKAALDNGLTTVAVLAHGLDMIYPSANRSLAAKILEAGGALISEYPSKTTPYQRNFLQRNRIVAGLCEALVVVESEVRGGAMSTANQAFSYSREVFALPGRVSDVASSGCNALIAKNKANIFISIADFMNVMNWNVPALGAPAPKKSLFPELEGAPAKVYAIILKAGSPLAIDSIHYQSGLSMPELMSALTDLEFEGIVNKLPGARYELA